MPDLVSLAELKTYLGITVSTDDVLLTDLLEHVEALLESETGRTSIPFQAGDYNRTEAIEGSNGGPLYVDYPIDVLRSVKLGLDPAAPDETLVVTDKRVLLYTVGSRKIIRTDGGTFGRWSCPSFVQVVYDFQDDLPENAKLAVKSVASMAYQRRGSELEKSETVGAFYSHTLVSDIATDDPFWKAAVAANRRGSFV